MDKLRTLETLGSAISVLWFPAYFVYMGQGCVMTDKVDVCEFINQILNACCSRICSGR